MYHTWTKFPDADNQKWHLSLISFDFKWVWQFYALSFWLLDAGNRILQVLYVLIKAKDFVRR